MFHLKFATFLLFSTNDAVGSTPGQVAIKWLLLGWVIVCGQVNHLGI